MPVRSIELKLARPEMGNEAWKALGFTHERVIQEAQAWMKDLLLLRGRALATSDERLAKYLGNPNPSKEGNDLFHVSEAQVRARLAETIAKRVGGSPAKHYDAVDKLRELYDLVIPSVMKKDEGDAQAANRLMGPLADPESEGGLSAIQKAEAPEWVSLKENGANEEWRSIAESWRRKQLDLPRQQVVSQAGAD